MNTLDGVLASFNGLQELYRHKEKLELQVLLAILAALGLILLTAVEPGGLFLSPWFVDASLGVFLIVSVRRLWGIQHSQRSTSAV